MRSEQGRHEFEMQDDYSEHEIQELTQEISDIKGQLTAEIEKCRQFEKTLSKHLKFDRLLSEFSSRFANIPFDQADRNIEHALKRICEFFGCELCALLEVLPDKAMWKVTHVAATDDIPPVLRGTELQSSICPWFFQKVIQNRESFSFSRLDELPLEASMDKKTFLELGIRSLQEVPIISGDSVDRVIFVCSVRKECEWLGEVTPKLQILGEIIANALELKGSQTLHDTLINSTSDMIWSVDSERFGLTTFNRGLYEYFLHGIGIHIRVGMTPHDLLPTEEYAQKWCTFYRCALEEGSFTTEYQVYTKNRTLRLNFNTLKRDDAVFGISVFGQDITELKGMEEQMRKQLLEIETLKRDLCTTNVPFCGD